MSEGSYRNGDGDRITPVELPASRVLLEEVHNDCRHFRKRFEEVDGTLGEMMGEVGRYRQDAERAHKEHAALIRSVASSVAELTKAAQAQAKSIRELHDLVELRTRQTNDALERFGELADSAFRTARDSSHELDRFKVEVRKMKPNVQTMLFALGAGALALVAAYLHIDQPGWLVGLEIAIGGAAMTQLQPAIRQAEEKTEEKS